MQKQAQCCPARQGRRCCSHHLSVCCCLSSTITASHVQSRSAGALQRQHHWVGSHWSLWLTYILAKPHVHQEDRCKDRQSGRLAKAFSIVFQQQLNRCMRREHKYTSRIYMREVRAICRLSKDGQFMDGCGQKWTDAKVHRQQSLCWRISSMSGL